MSSYRQACTPSSFPLCQLSCPQPWAEACNQPCITSCGDSRAVIYPPPVAITFPGPILSSCPQESFVGSSVPLELGSSFGSSFGPGAPLGGRFSYPCSSCRFSTFSRGSCGPC